MIHVRSDAEIERIRHCGQINAQIHKKIARILEPGITTQDLNDVAVQWMHAYKVTSSIRDQERFPGDICISRNAEVGHGIPNAKRLCEGDIVKIDISILFEGYHTDCAMTYLVGKSDIHAKNLLTVTKQALSAGITSAQSGRRCSDISYAMERIVQNHGYTMVRKAFGHGIGTDLHEAPSIANFGPANRGPRLRPGMVIAIEPVVSTGSGLVIRHSDGWTDITADQSRTAHFEHTVLITENQPEVMTTVEKEENPKNSSADSSFFLLFRPMKDAEKDVLLRLAQQEMDPILIEAWGRKVQAEEIFMDLAQICVVESPTKGIVGFFSYSIAENVLHLNTLVLDAQFQGLGLGQQVMAQFEKIAKNGHLQILRLCVQMNNLRAIRFYQKWGFRIQGKPYVNTYLMRKRLE